MKQRILPVLGCLALMVTAAFAQDDRFIPLHPTLDNKWVESTEWKLVRQLHEASEEKRMQLLEELSLEATVWHIAMTSGKPDVNEQLKDNRFAQLFNLRMLSESPAMAKQAGATREMFEMLLEVSNVLIADQQAGRMPRIAHDVLNRMWPVCFPIGLSPDPVLHTPASWRRLIAGFAEQNLPLYPPREP